MKRSKKPIRARLRAKGNLFAFNRFISAVLIGACLLTWSVPSYALRTTELQESEGKGLTEFLSALGREVVEALFPQTTAGLEEQLPAELQDRFEVDGSDFKTTRAVVVRAGDTAQVLRLPNGTTIEAKRGAEVRIAPGVTLEERVKIVASQDKVVTIGSGSKLLTDTRIHGNVRIGRNTQIDATVTGDTVIGDGTFFAEGSKTIVNNSVLVPITVRTRSNGQVVEKQVPVKVTAAQHINGSVVYGGSLVFQGAMLLNTVLGPWGQAGNHVMLSRSAFYGLLSGENRMSVSHHNDVISMYVIPLVQRRDLSDPEQRAAVQNELIHLRLGTLLNRSIEPLVTGGKPIRPVETLTMQVGDGDELTFQGATGAWGAHFTTSNLDPRNDGIKGPTAAWGGAWAGVGAVSSIAEIGPFSGIGSNAVASGQSAVEPGTLIVPEAAAPGQGAKVGRILQTRGRLGRGVEANMRVRRQAIHLLEVLVNVAVAGARQAQSQTELVAYRKEVELLSSNLDEAIKDMRSYLALAQTSVDNLKTDGQTEKVKGALQEQRRVLRTSYKKPAAEARKRADTAIATMPTKFDYTLEAVTQFSYPDSVVELIPGSSAYGPDVIARGQEKIRNRETLFVIFAAGRASRFANSVRDQSPEFHAHMRALGRVDDQDNPSKLTAPLAVSGFGPVMRQLEALSELGRRSERAVDVAIVDSEGNRQMLLGVMEQDRSSAEPRIAWGFLNFVSAEGQVVNGGSLQVVGEDGEPAAGAQVLSQIPLVDQGEGLLVTYASGEKMGQVVMEGEAEKRVPSGEYGAFMAGVQAAQAAGIDVRNRDVIPMYGDQAQFYSDADRLAALISNMSQADITGVTVQLTEVEPGWVPTYDAVLGAGLGGVVVKATWPGGESAVVIAERDVRDARSQRFNPLLVEQESQIGGYFPYVAGPPVFSKSFMGVLMDAQVDLQKQRKTIKVSPAQTDVEVMVSEMELTQLMQIGSQQGLEVQVARAEQAQRRPLKNFGNLPPANDDLFRRGKSWLEGRLGDRVDGNLRYVEVSPRASSFSVTGEGSLTIQGNVGVVVDHRGIWVHKYEGVAKRKRGRGIPKFTREAKLLIPAASGVIPLSQPVLVNSKTFDSLTTAGLEEPRSLPQAINRWLKTDATREEELSLQNWLISRGEDRIRRFVERVVQRLDLKSVDQFGAYKIPSIDPATIPAPGQKSGDYPIPSSVEEFESERIRMMAHIAVRRAFGHLRGQPVKVVANVGIGFVGTAVTIVTADADRYAVIAYQRPSVASSQKVNLVNERKMPVQTADQTALPRLKAAVDRGDLTATFLAESLAVADLIMLETELHFRKYHPKQIDQGESSPEASLALIRQVGSVMQLDATLLIESTVPPGFVEQEAWPVLTETLQDAQARQGRPLLPPGEKANLAYAFQRLEPGPRWIQSLLEYKRIGSGLTPKARRDLEEYFQSVGFQSFEIWSNTAAVAALKDIENAYRIGLIELTGGFLRGLERIGGNAWLTFAEIAADRPETHGSILFIPAIQEGQGYCCPKELGELIAGLKRNFQVSDLDIKMIFKTRIDAIAVSDYRAEDYAYWLIGMLDELGLSLRDAEILIAGASYKPGVGDTRWTGSERLIRLLAHYGAVVRATDPYVRRWPEFHRQQPLDPESWAFHLNNQGDLRRLDLATVPELYGAVNPGVHGIVLATRHWQYVGRHQLEFLRNLNPADPLHQVFARMFEGIDGVAPEVEGLDAAKLSARMMGLPGRVIVDTNNFLHDDDIKELLALGWRVRGSGKGHIPLLAQELTTEDRLTVHRRLVVELKALHGADGIGEGDRRAALRAAQARVKTLQAQASQAGLEEQDLLAARASLDETTNALRHALGVQRSLLEAERAFHQASVRYLETVQGIRNHGEPKALRHVMEEAQQSLTELVAGRQRTVVQESVQDVVAPTVRVIKSLLELGGAEVSALAEAGLARLKNPQSAEEAARIAQSLVELGDRVQGLRFFVDALMEAVLTPEGKVQMWAAMARLRAREELAVPALRTDLAQQVLLEDTIPILPGTYPVGDKNGGLYYYRGDDHRLHRVQRHPWNKTDFNSLTLKVVPDIARDPAGIPQAWGRFSLSNPLNLVPAVAPDGGAVINGFEAYPGAFDLLPPDFRRWMLLDVLGRGLVPTTMDGEQQSEVGLVMQVNLQTTTPARGRGGLWYDRTTNQPYWFAADGFEWLLDIKALGPYGGGDPLALEYSEDRVVSGGRSGQGKAGVARSRLGQLLGFQQDWAEIHNLWTLRGTEAWEKGWVSRPVFILRFQFAGNPDHTVAMVGRAVPTNERLGQSHIGQPDFVSNRIGWNTAEILHYPQSAVHIALTADNLMSNGYATDMGSLIWLHNERDPRGALNKYGGFSMQIPLFTFQEIKSDQYDNPRGEFLVPWMKGFRERFLESRVGQERIHNPERFERLLDPSNPILVDDPNGAIDGLFDAIWNHYLPWQILSERLEFGYDAIRGSSYTQTSGTTHAPELRPALMHTTEGTGWAVVGPAELKQMAASGSMQVTLRATGEPVTVTAAQFKRITGRSIASVRNVPYQRAKEFIRNQRELLQIAQRLIEEEGYPDLGFDFAKAFQVLNRKDRAVKKGLASYADTYDLSEIYPAKELQVIPIISNLEAMATGVQPVPTALTRMLPSVMAEKAGVAELIVTGQGQQSPQQAGLEEQQQVFTINQWRQIVEDPEGSGFKAFVEQQVIDHRVEGELKKVQKLVREAERKRIFQKDKSVVLARAPGRARIFMGHPDLPGDPKLPAIGGFSLDAATSQSVWMLVQLTDDGKVVADNVDPSYRRLRFQMDAEDVLPVNADQIEDRSRWLEWSEEHPFDDKWEGLVKGTLAVIRTKMLDPLGLRRQFLTDRGFRILLSESDIPSGMGFSASSSIPAGLGLTFNAIVHEAGQPGLALSHEQLTRLDLAAYPTGDIAGMADITAILTGEKYMASVIWYDPDRLGDKLMMPQRLHVFAFDSGVRRLDEPGQPEHLKDYARYIKTLTNISVPLAVLWMRHLSRTKQELQLLDEVLTRNHPHGAIRELTEAGILKQKRYAQMVAGSGQPMAVGTGAKQKRRRFVENLLVTQVPNDWTLGQIVETLKGSLPELEDQINALGAQLWPLGAYEITPSTKSEDLDPDSWATLNQMRMDSVIPMRQMALYGINEIERGLVYLQAIRNYSLVDDDEADDEVATMLEMMRQAHDGDRALYDPTQPPIAGAIARTSWGLGQPAEAFQRSLAQLDAISDQMDQKMAEQLGVGPEVVRRVFATRISGAGLGGLFLAAANVRFGEVWGAVMEVLGRKHTYYPIEPSNGARVVKLAIPVEFVLTTAGLEEGIRLKPGVATERLIFVSSGLASPALFQGVRQFRPAAGEQLSVVVFAEHALHAEEIEGWAAEAGITLREIVNVKDQYSGDEPEAIANKLGQYEGRYQVHLVQLPSDLDGLGRFLQIDPVKFRTWQERYEETLYGSQV